MASAQVNQVSKTSFLNFNNKLKKQLSKEDLEIVNTLEKLKLGLDNLDRILNNITDPILIDSYIYEINALNMRYKYYLNLSKERELIADGYDF